MLVSRTIVAATTARRFPQESPITRSRTSTADWDSDAALKSITAENARVRRHSGRAKNPSDAPIFTPGALFGDAQLKSEISRGL
ncbi:hypothetical protein SISSUDRAFT_1054744 [Sistotremastrum suecicum HHB10207 ss-3]|uniref:Uncharacterized protein n=1 Tax=Sistotremastrum suecicum HHB10207 ss-3 TaxID=1314776 RepID=A0A165Y8W7_9AGAM|nr:hypothetical protein SISSUDRAFT_1054744 [Sistotremastrum suecicum HHB10207 ss-3]